MATDHDNEDNLAGLRAKAKLADDMAAENAELKKKLLFAEAGIDTSTKVGGLLYKTWDGDDLAALKAEGEELGLFAKPDTTPAPTPAQQDQGQQQFRDAMANGRPAGEVPNPVQEDPQGVALREFHGDLQKGQTRQAAGLAAIDKVLVQAASGNRNAIFDPDAWAQQARQEAATRS